MSDNDKSSHVLFLILNELRLNSSHNLSINLFRRIFFPTSQFCHIHHCLRLLLRGTVLQFLLSLCSFHSCIHAGILLSNSLCFLLLVLAFVHEFHLGGGAGVGYWPLVRYVVLCSTFMCRDDFCHLPLAGYKSCPVAVIHQCLKIFI